MLCASDAADAAAAAAAAASRLRHHDSADEYLSFSLLCDLVLLISVDKPPKGLQQTTTIFTVANHTNPILCESLIEW